MDKIFISALQVETLIGIYPEERKQRQPLILDIELGIDARKAAQSEHINDTINYDELAERLQQWALASEFFLLEALAEYLAQSVLQTFSPYYVRLRLNKPNAMRNALAGTKEVGIEIVREKVNA